jgi:sugar (pentulose or hexulose) kinase
MFKSTVFCRTLATVMECPVELVATDVAVGAAQGAVMGAGLRSSWEETLSGVEVVETVLPMQGAQKDVIDGMFDRWCLILDARRHYLRGSKQQ